MNNYLVSSKITGELIKEKIPYDVEFNDDNNGVYINTKGCTVTVKGNGASILLTRNTSNNKSVMNNNTHSTTRVLSNKNYIVSTYAGNNWGAIVDDIKQLQ